MNNASELTALILAGGLGTRLRSVVSDRPKVLATVNERPFLQYILDELKECGISRTIICTGYLAGQIEETFGTRYGGMEIAYSREAEPIGTGGALRLALPLIETEQVMVLNGDSFCAVDHDSFRAFHTGNNASMSLCLAEVPDVSRYGAVTVDHSGRIVRFEEKGSQKGPGAINAGIYLMTRALIGTIPPERAVSLEREIIPQEIGGGLYGFTTRGRFIDIGIPSDYEAAEDFFHSP